jgi:predicted nucleic acid-binding protein
LIYLDTSVVLAHILAEDRYPPPSLWTETLVSSRLLEYEVWTRIHARRLAKTHDEAVRAVLGRVAFLEMIPDVVMRAREAFPSTVRTLDALHLASLSFLMDQGQPVALASYDERMLATARRMKIEICALS